MTYKRLDYGSIPKKQEQTAKSNLKWRKSGFYMTRSQYLGALMDSNTDNRFFVNILPQAAERKKSKSNHAAWYLVLGLSEALGTGTLIFFGCSGVIPSIGHSPPSHLQISLVFGIAVSVIVQVFGHISGAHINPAVTVAALIFKLISIPAAAVYFVAQFIGGVLGYGALLVMTPKEALYPNNSNMNVTHGFCTTVPNPKVTTMQALLAEYVATAILIFLCCSVWDKRNATKQDSVAIKFGLTIAGLAAALGPFSGGSMNPARTFAPAIFTGVWDRQWIYWLGPLSAAVVTSYFYKFLFERNRGPTESDHADIPLNQHSNSKVQNIEKLSAEDIATL